MTRPWPLGTPGAQGSSMYGMVNRAFEELVTRDHGEATWERIRRVAGVDVEVFLSNDGYDDALTYALVGATAEVLQRSPAELLREFGRHFVLQTAPQGYGVIMDAAGSSLGEFLEYLPNLHARVALVLPHLDPPKFSVRRLGRDRYWLRYDSHRKSLAWFVVGLIEGLGIRFGEQVRLSHLVIRDDDSVHHDEFEIRWDQHAGAHHACHP